MKKLALSAICLLSLLATLAYAADKYLSSSGDLILRTAVSKKVNIQDTLYTTQDGKVGIGATPTVPFQITKEVGSNYQAIFSNDNGAAYGLQVKIKSNDTATNPALDVTTWDSGTTYTSKFRVQRDGAVLMGPAAGRGKTGIYPRAALPNGSSVTLQTSSSYSSAGVYMLITTFRADSGLAGRVCTFAVHSHIAGSYITKVTDTNLGSGLGSGCEGITSGTGNSGYFSVRAITTGGAWYLELFNNAGMGVAYSYSIMNYTD